MTRRLRENTFVLLTFCIAAIIILVVFILMGLSPFGTRQIMVIDSWHQYFPAVLSLHRKIRSGGSLFYTWFSGGGTNYLTFIGYYALSPINLLSLLFPEAYLQEFFWMSTLVKISLAGSFFSYYIKKVYLRHDLSISMFGLAYSFCGFFVGYYWNIMWLDVVVLFPLVILGLHQFMDEGKYKLYVATLALSIVSNFYIAIFVCEFVAIYYFVLYFTKQKSFSIKHFFKKLVGIAAYSVLSIILSAITFLPIIYGMTRAYGQSSANPTSIETYYSLMDLFNNLLLNITPTVIDGLPNISSSLLVLTLTILYFANNKVETRKKLIYGGLILFLFMSMNINVLNFVWHGLHFPNQVPFRFSFVVSFVLITMAYEAFLNIKVTETKDIKRFAFFVLIYFIFAEAFYTSLFDFKVFYPSLIVMLIYLGIVNLHLIEKLSLNGFITIGLLILIFESFLAFDNATTLGGTTGRDEYNVEAEAINEILDYIEEKGQLGTRVEMVPRYSTNDALSYGYRGLVQFASTANSRFATYTQYMGMPSDPGSNTIAFEANTPALNNLFALRYMISKYNHVPLPNEGYDLVYEVGNVKLLENKFALPLMYVVNEEIRDLSPDIVSPFERQLRFYNLATGQYRQFFAPIAKSADVYTNLNVHSVEGARHSFTHIDPTQGGSGLVEYVIGAKDQYYLYMLNQTPTMVLTVNGVSQIVKTPRGGVVDLGVLEVGTPISIQFDVIAAESGYFDLEIVSFDELMFEEISNELKEHVVEITTFEDTLIEGRFSSDRQGLLYTSIPYEEGWTVKVDGKEVEAIGYKSAVLVVPVEPGEHSISMTYRPRGFVLGAILSIIGVGVYFLLPLMFRIFDKTPKEKEKEVSVND